MINRRIAMAVSATALGTALAPAAPAAAGGIGDVLSPAFGTSCANLHTGARANGTTTHGTGAANGNPAGLPVGSALNQCGGADDPAEIACVANQFFAAEKVLAQSGVKEGEDLPIDVLVKMLSVSTTAEVTTSHAPCFA
ncbi:hypothetical protein [Streptomyces sp. NPDC018045]|uniref:hypothetical protein n=1 Tax=Streptomyces sp. NPDC018045 TaxID=3365037 RepID=UPI0037B6883A